MQGIVLCYEFGNDPFEITTVTMLKHESIRIAGIRKVV